MITKKLIPLILSLASISISTVQAQKDSVLQKVPHQISVEFGYRYSFYPNTGLTTDATLTGLPNHASNGVGILADYGWQLTGLDGKKPAIYLTVPLGYTMLFPDDPQSKRVGMLNYGWTVRHELATKDKKLIPFIGYGLFLSNLSEDGVAGSVSGHQTQFEGGVNFKTTGNILYFAKLQASYSSYPKLGYSKSLHFMYADLRIGIRF